MAITDDGYCEHGKYVGGIGIDWMCGWCEDGVPFSIYQAYLNRQVRTRTKGNVLATVFAAMPHEGTPTAVVSIARGLVSGIV